MTQKGPNPQEGENTFNDSINMCGPQQLKVRFN